jgi:hypothetical protein
MFNLLRTGVDNFAHLGGFLMGLLTAIVLYPVISMTKRHKMIMWACRLAMIPIAVVLFVVLIRNFYKSDPYAGMFWFSVTCSGVDADAFPNSLPMVPILVLYSGQLE